MSYSFQASDTSLADSTRRIALNLIDVGLKDAANEKVSKAERIHELRKRCKKLRGLIRLIRPGFPDFSDENAAFRDLAKQLSVARDARAMVETCQAISVHFSGTLADDAFAEITSYFEAAARDAEAAPDLGQRLSEATEALKGARERVVSWTLEPDDVTTMRKGVRKTFARARKAMAGAKIDGQSDTMGEAMHEWRKQAKYHGYHLRLLKNTSRVVRAAVKPADDLSDILGDHHDLHVMGQTLGTLDKLTDATTLSAFRGLMGARQKTLEDRAFLLGGKVFAEKPKAASDRLASYWSIWKGTD